MRSSTHITHMIRPALVVMAVALTLVAAACGSENGDSNAPANEAAPPAQPDASEAATPADEPATASSAAAEEVAMGFLEAFGAFDMDKAITYLADDAEVSGLIAAAGAENATEPFDELRLWNALLEAQRFKQIPGSCDDMGSGASGTSLQCTFDFQLFGSDELGLGPFTGSHVSLTVLDGKIVRASTAWAVGEFSPQVWEPFEQWVSSAHPKDAAVMYVAPNAARLTEESIQLWEQRIPEYVEVGADAAAAAPAQQPAALILDTGFLGVPPEGVQPSAPESGELVLSYVGRPSVPVVSGEQCQPPDCNGRYRVWVYADGRMIWDTEGSLPAGASKSTTGFLEQRLTPEGVQRLRSEAVSTGLFGHDLALIDGSDFNYGTITVREGEQLVQVDWEALKGHVGDLSFDPSRYRDATREQSIALERLTAKLTNPASWLPANAWENRKIRAYVPSRMAVCAAPWGWYAPGPALWDWAKELLRDADMHDGCYDVTLEKARAIANALEDAGLERVNPQLWQAYRLDSRGAGRLLQGDKIIFFLTILPHGDAICQSCG